MALNLTVPLEFKYSSRSDAEVRWPIWKRRIEIFLKASGIEDDERKWAIMLNQAGTQVQEVFFLNWPNQVQSYTKAIELLDNFFVPKKNKELCILEFYDKKQLYWESIDDFASRLKSAAVACEFGEREIKRQLFIGTRHESVRREILDSNDDDTTEDILRRVREAELVENLVKVTLKAEVLNKEPMTEAKKSDDEKQVKDKKEASNGELFCYRCGGEFPHQSKCPALLNTCNMCGKRGHYEQKCYRKLGTYVRNQDGYCYFLAFKDKIKSSSPSVKEKFAKRILVSSNRT